MAANPEWRKKNRAHLREYMRAYRKKNHARLELKRKCRLAGIEPPVERMWTISTENKSA